MTKKEHDEMLELFKECFRKILVPRLEAMADRLCGINNTLGKIEEKLDRKTTIA